MERLKAELMTTETDDPLANLASLASRYLSRINGGPPIKKKRASRALPFTKASITRRADAAQAAGLDVSAILPDGTILTSKASGPTVASDSKWLDLKA
jgi:hypothetical protein